MGKIFNSVDELIYKSRKEKDSNKLRAYQNLKAELTHAKIAKNDTLSDAEEIISIKKMINRLTEDVKLYKQHNREALALESANELLILQEFVPNAATESEIKSAIENYITEHGQFSQRDMGTVVNYVKSQFDNCDGKTVAMLVKQYIS